MRANIKTSIRTTAARGATCPQGQKPSHLKLRGLVCSESRELKQAGISLAEDPLCFNPLVGSLYRIASSPPSADDVGTLFSATVQPIFAGPEPPVRPTFVPAIKDIITARLQMQGFFLASEKIFLPFRSH